MTPPNVLIREARGKRSQKWLAKKVGVSTRAVMRWENREQPQYPSARHIPKINRALGITIPPKPPAPGPLSVRLQALEDQFRLLREEFAALQEVVEDRLRPAEDNESSSAER